MRAAYEKRGEHAEILKKPAAAKSKAESGKPASAKSKTESGSGKPSKVMKCMKASAMKVNATTTYAIVRSRNAVVCNGPDGCKTFSFNKYGGEEKAAKLAQKYCREA